MATTKSLLEAFSHFDTDGSGKLDGETNPGAADFWGDAQRQTHSPALPSCGYESSCKLLLSPYTLRLLPS